MKGRSGVLPSSRAAVIRLRLEQGEKASEKKKLLPLGGAGHLRLHSCKRKACCAAANPTTVAETRKKGNRGKLKGRTDREKWQEVFFYSRRGDLKGDGISFLEGD